MCVFRSTAMVVSHPSPILLWCIIPGCEHLGAPSNGTFWKCTAFEADSCDSKPESFDGEILKGAAVAFGKWASTHSLSEKGWHLQMILSNIRLKAGLCPLTRKEDSNLIQRMSSLSSSRNWSCNIPGWLAQPHVMIGNYLYFWHTWFSSGMELLCLHRKPSSRWAIWSQELPRPVVISFEHAQTWT